MHNGESIALGLNFRNGEFYEFARFEIPWIQKSNFCALSVCVSVISITQKQITAETSNLVFNIRGIYRYYLKHFMKIGQKFCMQGHTKEL